MMRRLGGGSIGRPVQIALGAGAAAVVVGALWGLSQAPGQGGRLRALARAEPTRSASTMAPDMPLARPCRAPIAEGVSTTVEQLRRAAAQAALTLTTLDVGPGPDGLPTDLQAASLRLSADGAERAVTGFLAAASAKNLPLYPDALEVKRADGRLHLELTGRVLCRRGFR
jgi:hypothetical protein